AEKALDEAYITANKNAIPFDTNPPLNPSGIRLGSPAVTTRGFQEAEMKEVGRLIASVLNDVKSEQALAQARRGVGELTFAEPNNFRLAYARDPTGVRNSRARKLVS